MMKGGSSVHLRPHCFSVYPLMRYSEISLPTKEIACSSRLGNLFSFHLFPLLFNLFFASSGVMTPHIWEKGIYVGKANCMPFPIDDDRNSVNLLNSTMPFDESHTFLLEVWKDMWSEIGGH